MAVISRAFARFLRRQGPATAIQVIVFLQEAMDVDLRVQLEVFVHDAGGRIVGISPDSDFVTIEVPAGHVEALAALSDNIRAVMYDAPVEALKPM